MRSRLAGFAGLFLFVLLTPALADAPAWVLYVHPDKIMSLRFPGKPVEASQEAPSPIGTLKFKVATLDRSDRVYVATAISFPVPPEKFNVQGALDGARDNSVAKMDGKVLSEKSITVDGVEGREIVFETKEGAKQFIHGMMRVFASNSPPSTFVATAMRTATSSDPDAQKFVESMHMGSKVETRP